MKNPLIPMAIAALLLAPVAFAQTATTETTTQTPATDEPKSNEEFPVADDLEQTQVGQGYLRETHDKWEVRCIKAPEGEKEECRLFNLLSDKDNNPIAQLDMQALPKGNKAVAGLDIATPLGSLLTAQVVLKVDAGKARRYPYTWCDTNGCYARFGMTAGEIASLKKGAKATVTIVSVTAPNEPLSLDLSLKGFTAAWTAVAPK